jgi:hypothetical protein
MNKKILGIAVVLLAMAILATPVIADPTKGQKVPATLRFGDSSPAPGTSKTAGNTMHGQMTVIWQIEIDIDGVPTYTGTAVAERYSVNVAVEGKMTNIVFKEVYTIEIDDADGGFVGSVRILMRMFPGMPPTILGKAHVLLVGYGDFEGQTLNVGHHWSAFSGGIAWDGYLLKP